MMVIEVSRSPLLTVGLLQEDFREEVQEISFPVRECRQARNECRWMMKSEKVVHLDEIILSLLYHIFLLVLVAIDISKAYCIVKG